MGTNFDPFGLNAGADLLVVDDSRSMRAFITGTLEEAGYSCDQAGDGNEGILLSLRNPYRLILSDYDMPGVNGLSFVTRLRASAKTRDTPVVMITARAEAAIVREMLAVGVNGYILKPFQAPQLLEQVRALISPRQPGGGA